MIPAGRAPGGRLAHSEVLRPGFPSRKHPDDPPKPTPRSPPALSPLTPPRPHIPRPQPRLPLGRPSLVGCRPQPRPRDLPRPRWLRPLRRPLPVGFLSLPLASVSSLMRGTSAESLHTVSSGHVSRWTATPTQPWSPRRIAAAVEAHAGFAAGRGSPGRLRPAEAMGRRQPDLCASRSRGAPAEVRPSALPPILSFARRGGISFFRRGAGAPMAPRCGGSRTQLSLIHRFPPPFATARHTCRGS
jgi:hypothetical protein